MSSNNDSEVKVVRFPGTTEISEAVEPQIDFEALADAQGFLLEEWLAFGEEMRRRLYSIPSDLSFELSELLRKTRE
jgi:hypothetical protein